MKNETMTAARTYSPAVYLAALRHCAGTAAARGAETRRETARRAGTVRLTIAAVLQGAEDAAARRAPAPDPETIAAAIAPETAAPAPRPRFDIGAAARAASADYADMLTLDPSARSLPLWYHCLRSACAEIKDRETLTAAPGGFWTLTGEDQYNMLTRAAARVPAWAARAARRMDPDRAADLLPSARWTLYQSGTRTGAGDGDDREIVFRSTRDYEWIARETARGDRRGAIDAIAAETWTRLASRRDRGDDLTGEDYFLTIYRETMQAAAAIGRRDHDRPRRQKETTRSLDEPAMLTAARTPSPEAETVTRETIRAAAADDLDRIILRGLRYGWSQGQIARYAGEIAARDRARAAGETLTPEEIETARAAGETYQRRISRKIAAMADRLRAAGVLRPADDPGYWSAHNPGPAPIASAAAPAPDHWNWTRDPETVHNAAPVPAPAPAPRETAPDRPAPSRAYSAPLTLPAPADRLPRPYAVPETPAPAQTGTPEAPEADPLRETLRAADRRASASLARLAARREEEARRREEETARRASAPVRYAPASPEDIARRERLARAAQTVREAMARRAARRVR